MKISTFLFHPEFFWTPDDFKKVIAKKIEETEEHAARDWAGTTHWEKMLESLNGIIT